MVVAVVLVVGVLVRNVYWCQCSSARCTSSEEDTSTGATVPLLPMAPAAQTRCTLLVPTNSSEKRKHLLVPLLPTAQLQ